MSSEMDLIKERLKRGFPIASHPPYPFPLGLGRFSYYENEEYRKAVAAKHELFIAIAQPLIDKYGEEAKNLIRKSIYDMGFKAGELYAKAAGEQPGSVKNWDVLLAGWNVTFPHSPCMIVQKTDKRLVVRILRCLAAETYLNLRVKPEVARLYCDIDYATFEALNPKIKYSRPKWIVKGDPYCEYDLEFKE